MVVTGGMKEITAESAHRAALGAGAIVSMYRLDDSGVPSKRSCNQTIRPDMCWLQAAQTAAIYRKWLQ